MNSRKSRFSFSVFMMGSANDGHGGESFLMAAVFPGILTIPEFPQASFFDDLFHGALRLQRTFAFPEGSRHPKSHRHPPLPSRLGKVRFFF